jgi:hypothetical protein
MTELEENMRDERVIYNFLTGHPQDIVSDVLRSISAYTREDRVTAFKIGITNNPERRFKEAYDHYYSKMAVVYRSTSINNVAQLEHELIEHNRELADNIISGGGGREGRPPHFMYVVMR